MTDNTCFHVLVAIALHTAAGRMKLNGINKFLSEGRLWDIELIRTGEDFTRERMISELKKDYDGLLIFQPCSRELLSIPSSRKMPIVFTDHPFQKAFQDAPYCVFVRDDTRDVMSKAIGHLFSCRGINFIAYVQARKPTPWSNERRDMFKSLMGKRAIPFGTFDGESEEDLASWLKALPKPAGLIAAYDDRGKDILEIARKANLKVPDDISVIGIGNDEPVCEMTRPQLSSVAIDFAMQGYRAARELQAMMLKCVRPRRRDILVGASQLILRNSTGAAVSNADLIRRALQYIDRHALEGIAVPDVVRQMRVSRRLADLRFREIAGCSILQAILNRRIDEAKRLLAETEDEIVSIAMRCGYPDNNYFKNVFKRLTGLSPRSWRTLHRRS